RNCGTPACIPESRIAPAHRPALVKPSAKSRKRQRLCSPSEIPARVFNRSFRPPECLLAGLELCRQTHGRQAGQRDGAAGNASAAVDHLEAEPISNGISLGLMQLEQDFSVGLSVIGARVSTLAQSNIPSVYSWLSPRSSADSLSGLPVLMFALRSTISGRVCGPPTVATLAVRTSGPSSIW